MSQSEAPAYPSGHIATSELQTALRHLERAAAGDETLLTAIMGCEAVCRASATAPDLLALSPELASNIPLLLFATAPLLSSAVSGSISEQTVHFGLGSISALLTRHPDEFWIDRFSYGALLVSDLKRAAIRADLERRGDPLMRAIAIMRAAETPRAPTDLLN